MKQHALTVKQGWRSRVKTPPNSALTSCKTIKKLGEKGLQIPCINPKGKAAKKEKKSLIPVMRRGRFETIRLVQISPLLLSCAVERETAVSAEGQKQLVSGGSVFLGNAHTLLIQQDGLPHLSSVSLLRQRQAICHLRSDVTFNIETEHDSDSLDHL